MKRFLIFAFSLATLSASGDVIKIVSSLPRTGSANAQAQTMVNGIKMALDEVHGKVGGFTIAYEDWDDASPERGQWDPAVEAANAQKAVKDPDVMAYIGTYNSGAAKIAMPILNQAGITMVSPANTYPGLTKPGLGEANEPAVYRPTGKVNYFRIVPADDIQGDVAANFAKDIGVKKVFVLHDRELYGKAWPTCSSASPASWDCRSPATKASTRKPPTSVPSPPKSEPPAPTSFTSAARPRPPPVNWRKI